MPESPAENDACAFCQGCHPADLDHCICGGWPSVENDAPTWDSLRAVRPSIWREHRPVGAYLPVGQLDGDCQCGRGAWPCPDFLAAHARVLPPEGQHD